MKSSYQLSLEKERRLIWLVEQPDSQGSQVSGATFDSLTNDYVFLRHRLFTIVHTSVMNFHH